MRYETTSRIDQDVRFISDLIHSIREGEIKIPQFQRPYVWKPKQALDLLDSLSRRYPVGSLLLWRTHEKLRAERNIGTFRLPDTRELSPTDYVLDGQQRLTVIFSCLGASKSDEGFSAGYDLRKDVFIESPEVPDPFIFPLRHTFSISEVLQFREQLRSLPNADTLQDQLSQIVDAFHKYRLPVVTLSHLSVDEVCPIFERINSSGTKLSTFHLIVAATWKRDFNLNEEVNVIKTALRPKGYGAIDPDTILKCLAAVQFSSFRQSHMIELRKLTAEEMGSLVARTKKSLLRAVDLLATEFKIHTFEFLPYQVVLVILCYIFSRSQSLGPAQVVRLRQWFWRAAFSERYRVGGENFPSSDMRATYQFVVDGKGIAATFGEVPSETLLQTVLFRAANSRARAFILALAKMQPRNLTNGAIIDTSVALAHLNVKEYHHIYPRAYLKRNATPTQIDSLVNICMLARSENNRISDQDPHLYLPEIIERLGGDAEVVFSTNLLPMPSEFDYAVGDYLEFMSHRARVVRAHMERLCEGTL